jgi:hypothetical protein
MKLQDQIETLENYKNISISIATGSKSCEDFEQYSFLRKKLIKIDNLKKELPEWVGTCRNGSEFWDFIKKELPTYQARRAFIKKSLDESFLYLEETLDSSQFALDQLLDQSMSIFNSEELQKQCQKAISRRISDPEGAMTLARTMLETVCKHILDELDIDYQCDKELTLQKLYSFVAKHLKLSPDQQTEKEFKKILEGLSKVVDGLTIIRGLTSDAHGTGRKKYKIAEWHSVLAINSAFTLIIFLADTFKEKQGKFSK